MKTELDLLVEALARLEREHTAHNKAVDERLNDLTGRLERWARLLTRLHTQLSAVSAHLERSGRDEPRK